MKATVTFDDDELQSVHEELAGKIELIDQSLRTTFSGFDVDTIAPEAKRSLAEIGVELSEPELQGYARSISDRRDFEFVLG